MIILHSEKDLRKVWPYLKYEITKHPKKYPCVFDVNESTDLFHGCNITKSISYYYPPDGIEIDIFCKILNNPEKEQYSI